MRKEARVPHCTATQPVVATKPLIHDLEKGCGEGGERGIKRLLGSGTLDMGPVVVAITYGLIFSPQPAQVRNAYDGSCDALSETTSIMAPSVHWSGLCQRHALAMYQSAHPFVGLQIWPVT